MSASHRKIYVASVAYSDGDMDRPALKRLLADIEAGNVDIVVVCKIDRLTRSLTDFSRMIEVFKRHGVSFVSVTQQFNTTTSCERVSVNSHATAKMLVRPGGGQGWLRPTGPWRRVKGRWKPVVSGLRVAGSRGFRGRVVGETGSSRVDNHKIRELCFLCSVKIG